MPRGAQIARAPSSRACARSRLPVVPTQAGKMTAAPIPAPRNSRVGSNCAGRDQTLPASKNVERYNIWDTRIPSSPVIVKNAFPNALGLAPLALALGS